MSVPRLAYFLPSYTEHQIEHSFDPHYFVVGVSATNFNGELVAVAWASDQYLDADTNTYKAYPPGTSRQPAKLERDKRPAFLLQLSNDFAVERAERLIPETSGDGAMLRNHGFDGTKPFVWRNRLWADLYVNRNPVRFFMARIIGNVLSDVKNLAPGSPNHEKNWMPEVIGDKLRFHCRLGELADQDEHYTMVEWRPDLAHMHGGTQVIPYAGEGLAIVRDFQTNGDALARKYRHYFVRIAPDGRPVGLSQPFVFQAEQVEIATGLTYHPDGKHLVIAHGSKLATVTLDEFRNMPWGGSPLPSPIKEHNR